MPQCLHLSFALCFPILIMLVKLINLIIPVWYPDWVPPGDHQWRPRDQEPPGGRSWNYPAGAGETPATKEQWRPFQVPVQVGFDVIISCRSCCHTVSMLCGCCHGVIVIHWCLNVTSCQRFFLNLGFRNFLFLIELFQLDSSYSYIFRSKVQ